MLEVRLPRPGRDRQRTLRIAVAIHGLPEQRDLTHASIDQQPNFGQDFARAAVALGAARVRHDAIRATLVAALHDRHERRGTGAARLCLRVQKPRRVQIEHGANARRRAQLDLGQDAR